jgi:hypothetical protein
MVSSDRVASGSLTRGSTIKDLGINIVSGSSDAFRQGINVRDSDDLTRYVSFKIRPNTDFTLTLDGREISDTHFNDELSPDIFASGNQKSTAQFFGKGKLGYKLTHEMELRDLGQSDIYDDVPPIFEDVTSVNPVSIIRAHPFDIVLPSQLLCVTDEDSLNGVMEPFTIRREVDLSSTELPYMARSIKGSVMGENDPWHRVGLISDGVGIEEIRNPTAVFFLDTVETMVIDITSVVSPDIAYAEPFLDTDDVVRSSLRISDEGDEIKRIMQASGSFNDDDTKKHEIMAGRGFYYQYSETGYDSIAFGGLKK